MVMFRFLTRIKENYCIKKSNLLRNQHGFRGISMDINHKKTKGKNESFGNPHLSVSSVQYLLFRVLVFHNWVRTCSELNYDQQENYVTLLLWRWENLNASTTAYFEKWVPSQLGNVKSGWHVPVSTHRSFNRLPPHVISPLFVINTCQGYAPLGAFWPPTILSRQKSRL